MLIKVHTDLLNFAVQGRHLVNRYNTNRTVKVIALYALLKTVTSTGVIHNYTEQPALRKLTKYSRNGFKDLVKDLVNTGLATVTCNNLKLNSWQKAVELTGQQYTPDFTYIDYNTENNTKLYYYFLPAEIAAKKAAQEKIAIQRLKENSTLKQATDSLISKLYKVDPSILTDQQYLDAIYQIQVYQFTSGTLTGEVMKFNPDCNRSASKLKQDWQFKSTLSITYWKRKLQQLGLIMLEKIGKLVGKKTSRLRQYGLQDRWCSIAKKPIWYRVDRIAVA